MSTLDKFQYDSNYTSESNFTRVRFGESTGILETELNEMQILQENNRASLARCLMPSGFLELIQKEFDGDPIVYNPINMGITQLNCVALAPARAIINGYELNLEGNFSYNGYNNYILVNLGDAPTAGTREDLVYLEVWFETMPASANIQKWGYTEGDNILNPMIDPRVKTETSRRVVLRWNIRIANNVNFDNFPNGFGYNDITNYSPIYAIANGQLGYGNNPNLIFADSNYTTFESCDFYKDNNLWVAGRPNYNFISQAIYGNYIFALPLFKVNRRNKTAFSIENFNGSYSFNYVNLSEDSSINGDLNDNIRPDKLNYDYIVPQDLVDLRKTIANKEFINGYYLDKGLQQLFTGQLQTKDTLKTRRVQFGNSPINYSSNSSIILACDFNQSIQPTIPTPTSIVSDSYTYKNSVNGFGVLIDGTTPIVYNVNGINVNQGTIDLFFQPYWQGPSDISQTFFKLLDNSNNPIFILEKKKTEIVFSQYDSSPSLINIPIVNTITLDLTNDILLAKNIYHMRISWCSSGLGSANGSFIYINGQLLAQGSYIPGRLIPSNFQIGAVENTNNTGFVVDELIIYNTSFDVLISTGTGYGYVQNSYWPNLPLDFISSDALLLPSFNSISNNFSYNICMQENTIIQLSPNPVTEGNPNKSYTLTISNDRIINNILCSTGTSPVVYDLTGIEVSGVWTGLGTNIAVFQSNSSTINEVVVQFDMALSAGNGGYDLPSEMLAAGLLINNSIKEVSFNRKGNNTPRVVDFARQRRVSSMVDIAYDFSNSNQNIIENISADPLGQNQTNYTFTLTAPTNKIICSYMESTGTSPTLYDLTGAQISGTWTGLGTNVAVFQSNSSIINEAIVHYDIPTRMFDQCFARLLYYNINGNGTDQYSIPASLYGYDVIGIQGVSSRKIIQINKLSDDSGGSYSIKFSTTILAGEVITFELALGGMTFDYETQSKTLISNLCKTKILEITATGSDYEFTIPCFQNEIAQGGVLKAIFTFTDNVFNGSGNLTSQPKYSTCYFNSQTVETTAEQNIWATNYYTVDPTSFGTPFIKIIFPENQIPPAGTIIRIPILVTYQLSQSDLLTIWYSYIPYQGLLSNSQKSVKRLSDWKYFITTLSSGKISLTIDETNIYSLNNIINRLPGGASYAYTVNGQNIVLNHLASTFNKPDINSQLLFIKDVIYGSNNNQFDQYFFDLNTDFNIAKSAEEFQDGNLNLYSNNFILYFPDCNTSITKYLGMVCLVADENGELMLLVIGSLDSSPNTINRLTPVYGDLFKIPGLPTVIQVN